MQFCEARKQEMLQIEIHFGSKYIRGFLNLQRTLLNLREIVAKINVPRIVCELLQPICLYGHVMN